MKVKVSKVGQPDVYVPAYEADGKTLNVDGVQGPGAVPLGGLVAVMPNIDVVIAWQPPATGEIKDGFMRADGTAITSTHKGLGCKLTVGTLLPNLTAKYLRGNTASGATGGANTVTIASANLPTHTHGTGTLANAADATHTHGVGTYGNTAELSHTHSSALPAHRHFLKSRGSGNDSPDHTHSVGYRVIYTQAGGSIDTVHDGDGSPQVSTGASARHTHSWGGVWSNDTSSQVSSPEGDGSGNTYADGVGYWGVGGTRTTSAGSSHNHVFSGTSAAGSSHNHVISGSTDNGGFANTALNNEPAYVEVVWVIRVK